MQKWLRNRKLNIKCLKFPGAPVYMIAYGGGATITSKKTQPSSPVAMGNNGHLQP